MKGVNSNNRITTSRSQEVTTCEKKKSVSSHSEIFFSLIPELNDKHSICAPARLFSTNLIGRDLEIVFDLIVLSFGNSLTRNPSFPLDISKNKYFLHYQLMLTIDLLIYKTEKTKQKPTKVLFFSETIHSIEHTLVALTPL